jgi:hypothetical protein
MPNQSKPSASTFKTGTIGAVSGCPAKSKGITKKKGLTAGSTEHRRQRWAEYNARMKKAGKTPMPKSQWRNMYKANMKNARRGNKAADDYHATRKWGKREVTVKVGTEVRRLDIADKSMKKGVEVKNYKTNVSFSGRVRREAELDKELVTNQNWKITWVFTKKGPSKPLREFLEGDPPIKVKVINP